MKRIAFMLLVMMLLLTGCVSKGKDFKDSNWGDSKQKVLKVEKEKLLKQDDTTLGYTTRIEDYNCLLAYEFKDNKLIKGTYLLDEVFDNVTDYSKLYFQLKDKLIEQYGKPDLDQIMNQKDIKNFAKNGGVISMTNWENKNGTEITLGLTLDNKGEFYLLLSYKQIIK